MRRALLALALAVAPLSAAATPSAEQARFDALVAVTKDDMLKDARGASEMAKNGMPLAAAIRDPMARQRAIATLGWLRAEALYRLNDSDRAAPLIAHSLTLARGAAPGSKLLGDALLTSGSIHGSRTEVASALAEFQEAHRIFSRLGDHRSEAITLICLAMLYVDGKDYTAALHYLDEALEAFPAEPKLAFAIYNSRGLIYQDQGRYDRAEAEFRQAYASAKRADATIIVGRYLRNIARSQLLGGKLQAADRTIAASRALVASSDDARQLDAVAAQAALQHGRIREAGTLIERAFAGVDLRGIDVALRDAHQTAVTIYQALGRDRQALIHLEALKRLDDKATRLATQTNTALMAARFDSANQDAKIARLRDAERLRQAREEVQRARTERTMWLGGAGATATIIVLLLIGLATIRRSRDEVRAANDDLEITNTALNKALAAKTEFLATTSHEIRTPLNGILGMTQVMLADGALPAATRDRLTVVQGAGMAMRSLVDDILDAAKMETGNLGLENAPFDLKTMLADVSHMWAEQARDKGVAFIMELDRCPARAEGDAARVRQIVSNLLSNAIKFTAKGTVTLTAEGADEGIRIAVSDTGIGIAADQHESVFESFRQADTSTTRQFGGTGLGLSISRNLARAMGGEVTLASRAGEGATFTAVLPLTVLAAQVTVRDPMANGDTLLVVDRNPITRAMLRTLFAPHVGSVAFAGSADEAVACLESERAAKVLIDEATARADGDPHGFVAAIAGKVDGATIAVLWTVATEADRDVLLALGVDEVIAKPIAGAALVSRLFPPSDVAVDQPSLVSRAA